MRKPSFTYALALAPLLLGAGGEKVSSLTVSSLPICSDGQYLAYQGGTVVCLSVQGGGVTLPTCTGQLLTSQKNGDVSKLGCIAKGQGNVGAADVTRVMNLQTQITQIGTTINNLKAHPPVAAAVYVGSTKNTTNGRVSVMGNDVGLNSANAMCSGDYPGSHLCTVYEMYNTVVAGKLHMGDSIKKSWLFMPGWKAPAAHSTAGVAGLPGSEDTPYGGTADNCGSFTYPTADRQWTGMAVEWTTLSPGGSGFKFWGGSQATCHDTYPLACCK